MSEQLAKNFIAALEKLESGSDRSDLVALFHPECSVGNVITPEAHKGREGAGEFWDLYRGTFSKVKSTFRNVICTDKAIVLEWETAAERADDGTSITYDGVSLMEVEGDQIRRFKAYFDPLAVGAGQQRAAR